jgi:hypothetical protein
VDIRKALVDSHHTRNHGSGHFQIEFILSFLGFKSPIEFFFTPDLEWASSAVHGAAHNSNGVGSRCGVKREVRQRGRLREGEQGGHRPRWPGWAGRLGWPRKADPLGQLGRGAKARPGPLSLEVGLGPCS